MRHTKVRPVLNDYGTCHALCLPMRKRHSKPVFNRFEPPSSVCVIVKNIMFLLVFCQKTSSLGVGDSRTLVYRCRTKRPSQVDTKPNSTYHSEPRSRGQGSAHQATHRLRCSPVKPKASRAGLFVPIQERKAPQGRVRNAPERRSHVQVPRSRCTRSQNPPGI